jgi:drug/metabolite transporter (DMT)-like permease
MVFLLLRIVFNVSFSHLLRLSQARTRRPMVAAGINYLVAAFACSGWAVAAGQPLHPLTLVLGTFSGFAYVAAMVLLLPSMRRSGVALTGSLMQLALMLPVAVAIWRFGELPNTAQWIGIALTVVALPILSTAKAVDVDEPLDKGAFWLPLGLFLSAGSSQVFMKEFSAARPPAELALFSAALFVSATIFTYAWMWLAKDEGRPDARSFSLADGEREIGEWPLGIALGTMNVLQLVFLLLALRMLPAVIVFPISASCGIVVNVLVSRWLWKEQPPLAGWVAIAMAVVAVVLLNLK